MAPSKSKQLGRFVRRTREEQGLTIRQLADKANMHFSLISYIESGERPATVDSVRKLARALRVPVEDLFALSNHMITDALPDFAPYLRAKFDLAERDIRNLQRQFDQLLEHKPPKKEGRGGQRSR